jgi:hypothetical protein
MQPTAARVLELPGRHPAVAIAHPRHLLVHFSLTIPQGDG